MKKAAVVLSFLLGAILLSVLFWLGRVLQFADAPSGLAGPSVLVNVGEGTKPSDLPAQFVGLGLVNDIDRFETYVNHLVDGFTILPGEYELNPRMSPAQILETFRRGRVKTHPFSFMPGSTADEVVDALVEHGLGSSKALRKAVRSKKLAVALRTPGPTLQGYLLPEVYDLPRGLAPKALFGHFVRAFHQHTTDIRTKPRKKRRRVVIVASLVQAAGPPEEFMPLVAAVYYNRIRRKMPLESVAALAYGLGKAPGKLRPRDRLAKSRYNTFRSAALPPTPINNPGRAALTAAMHPAASDALYFTEQVGGTFIFCPDRLCYDTAVRRFRDAAAESEPADP